LPTTGYTADYICIYVLQYAPISSAWIFKLLKNALGFPHHLRGLHYFHLPAILALPALLAKYFATCNTCTTYTACATCATCTTCTTRTACITGDICTTCTQVQHMRYLQYLHYWNNLRYLHCLRNLPSLRYLKHLHNLLFGAFTDRILKYWNLSYKVCMHVSVETCNEENQDLLIYELTTIHIAALWSSCYKYKSLNHMYTGGALKVRKRWRFKNYLILLQHFCFLLKNASTFIAPRLFIWKYWCWCRGNMSFRNFPKAGNDDVDVQAMTNLCVIEASFTHLMIVQPPIFFFLYV
jgi:hypothetical protein